MERPNVLWISLEDVSPRFGCYGDELARTPNIDRLAAGGCVFPRAFAVSGVCAPSRAAVITGMYPTAIGAHHMRTTHPVDPQRPRPYSVCPPPHVRCFTEYLRAAGYWCTNNEKTDYQFAPPLTAWDELGREAHWRHRPAGAPFFAVFNPTVTHESGMWPASHPGPPRTDPDRVELPPYLPDTRPCREALARHYDNLETADGRVGELLGELAADGLAQGTVVFLWSDHGEGLPRGKRWPYDAGIRVPLIVRWPAGLAAGIVDERLVSLIDLGPTVLSLTGAVRPAHLHGQPFLGPEAGERDYVYASRDRHDEAYDRVRAVRDERYKYIRHYHPERPYLAWIPYRNRHPVMEELWRLYREDGLAGAQRLLFEPRPAEELYDTEADPWETVNLADSSPHRRVLARLRGALDGWQRRVGDLGEVPETEMVRRWWEPDGTQPQTAPVLFVPIAAESPGREPVPGGGWFSAPCRLQLHCPTQGASIAYCTGAEGPGHWQLYVEPLRLPRGTTRMRAKAVRIGYLDSDETAASFTVG